MKKLFKSIEKTSSVPTLCQWDGLLENGKYIYIRWTNRFLGYGVGNTHIEAVDNFPQEELIEVEPDWNILSTSKMRSILKRELEKK